MKLVHCSWDRLDMNSFVPRVPQTRIEGCVACEDNVTPRICVADSVVNALKAMPRSGEIIKKMRKLRLPIIIHAYYLEQENKYVYCPTEDQVPDVKVTGEKWLLKAPKKVKRKDYIVEHALVLPCKDANNKHTDVLLSCIIKPTYLQSNYQNYLNSLPFAKYISVAKVETWKTYASFRELILSMDDEFSQLLKDSQIKKIWALLSDIPFDEDNDGRLLLGEDFALWKKGTEREEIWKWFDQNHTKGVEWLMEHTSKGPGEFYAEK